MALGRTYLDFARNNGGIYELMFRHDLLCDEEPCSADISKPLFTALTDAAAAARPRSLAQSLTAAGALWASLRGIAQLSGRGCLQAVKGAADPERLLRTALDAAPQPIFP